jgi:hypothetical protein
VGDTTRTVRVRFDGDTKGLAVAARDGNAQLARVARQFEGHSARMASSTDKVTDAQHRHADALGTLKVAEAQLDKLRQSERSTIDQVIAGEEKVAKARRAVQRATRGVERATKDANDVSVKWFASLGVDASEGFNTSFRAGIKAAGPTSASALGPAIVAAAPLVGAAAATGVVTAFGAGLVGIGLKVAAGNAEVRSEFAELGVEVGADLQKAFTPYEQTLLNIRERTGEVAHEFMPELAVSAKKLAPAFSSFSDQAISGLLKLQRTIDPVTNAFTAVLRNAGPQIPIFLDRMADGIVHVAEAVERNPELLGELIDQAGQLTEAGLHLLGVLTDVQGFFADNSNMGDNLAGSLARLVTPFDDLFVAYVKLTGQGDAFDRQIAGTPVPVQNATRSVNDWALAQQAAANEVKAHTDQIVAQHERVEGLLNADLGLRQAQLAVEPAAKAAAEAIKAHGERSYEARDAQLALEASYLGAAEAAKRKAEADYTGGTAEGKAATAAAAFSAELLRQAIAAGGTAPPALARLISGLSGSELAAIEATAATGKFRVAVVTLPDGRTVRVAVDDKGSPIIDAMRDNLASLHDKTINITIAEQVIARDLRVASSYGGPGRAAGGSTAAGRSYRVLERGPELLTVGGRDYLMMGSQGGYVTPNHQLGGPQVLEAHIHIGDEVVRVVRTEISDANRQLKRGALAYA